jgi:Glucose/sorbosone dehydrogenases
MFPRVRRWRSIGGLAAALFAFGLACGGGGGGGGGHGDDAALGGISLEAAFSNRSFSSPVKLVQHPTNDHRWYVVEQGGHVRTFLDTDMNAATDAANVASAVSLGGDSEQGLLGLAFDPGFATSGEVYLAYTDSSNRLVLARWVSANNGLTFTPDSIVLSIPHTPSTNHNGSDIMFGSDGFLYYSTGDGGGSDDPEDNAQNRNKLLGKILRIDVNATPPAGKTYAIPVTNPNHLNAQCNAGPGTAPCPEIFALGFRNPWRMNFDPATHKLYVGDVGQGAQEEIDLVTIGGNYGWDCLEGERDHSSLSGAVCSGAGAPTFIAPEVAYNDTSGPDSVTGGAVYRGNAIPGLKGFYIYTDFFRGPFFAFDTSVDNAPAQATSASEDNISAFGQGRDGEVYAVDLDGKIWKIVPASG